MYIRKFSRSKLKKVKNFRSLKGGIMTFEMITFEEKYTSKDRTKTPFICPLKFFLTNKRPVTWSFY